MRVAQPPRCPWAGRRPNRCSPVKEFAARTLVLQHGRIVEEGSSVDVCDRPEHEYTRRLVAAAPVPDPELQRVRRQRRLEVKVTA
ncbi:hypothetical protein [Streptomyces scabiei]|uniref:ABC transporter ATP-binding protein n=1 Tax=Streptomyces scabiei TaxID=1930 RepID=UPI0039F6A4C3